MSRKLTLKLSNLYLDLLNPRYDEQKSQNEALNTIASEQKDKLLALLKDILANGLNPSDIPIVMPDKDRVNGYIVLEGNRRIAALKLLAKPAILTNATLRQKYSKLHEKHKRDVVKGIECLIVDTREEASLWIERKHEGPMNGIGTVQWDSVQKGRFMANKTGRDSKAVQLIDFMKTATEGDDEFAAQLQKMSSTNLERLVSTPEVCAELGLIYDHGEYSSNYEWNEVMKGLRSVVARLANDDFKVGVIYRKKDRMDFISSIPRNELPDKTMKAADGWKLKDFKADARRQAKTEPPKEEEKPVQTNRLVSTPQRPTTRTTLVPHDLTLTIANDRTNRIFEELKQLSHQTTPNVCAVMMRVFLELSVDCYLEEFGLLTKGSVSASKDPRDLKHKANDVINHLNQKKTYLDVAKAKGIRTEFNNDQSVFSIDTMNGYVHNLNFNPMSENLMLSWDNIQPFIIAIWKTISDNQK